MNHWNILWKAIMHAMNKSQWMICQNLSGLKIGSRTLTSFSGA